MPSRMARKYGPINASAVFPSKDPGDNILGLRFPA
jgi:hypothetical protein